MKLKSLIKLTTSLLVAAAMMMPATAEAQSRRSSKQRTESTRQATLETELGGNIGSAGGAELKMYGTTGYYIPNQKDRTKRRLRLESYNKSTGRCVLKAYLRGKQIGKFDGKYENFCVKDDAGEEHWGEIYEGIFTNTINGAKLKFYLYND